MGRLYPERPIVGVGAIIVCDGKILLEKRRNDPGKGQWSIPGGLVDLGESLEDSVIREVSEETTLDVEEPQLLDVVNNIIADKERKIRYHFVIVNYFVKLKAGTPKACSDAEELRLVKLDEVEKYDLTKTFRAFFEKNKRRLGKLNSCP